MITVTVNRKKRLITDFEISGHAGSGPYGFDLVCAGVSAVSFGSVNAALTLCQVELDIEQGSEGGYLYVAIPGSLDTPKSEQVQLLFEGMIVSLKTIEREYSEFITLKDK